MNQQMKINRRPRINRRDKRDKMIHVVRLEAATWKMLDKLMIEYAREK